MNRRHNQHLLALAVLAVCQTSVMREAHGEPYAFLVAVHQYDKTELDPLEFTENDVTELATVLKQAGYPGANVVLLTQTVGASQTRYLPTAANIQRELRLVLKELHAEDSILLAFSGHGLQFAGEKETYFCAADARLADRRTLVPLGEVYQALGQCRAASKVLLVDACRNDPRSALARSARQAISLETVARPQAVAPPGGIAALFSCSAGQQSYEHPALKHGVFFHYVIRAFAGEADLDKDREISLAELEQYTAKNVQRYTRLELGRPQTPERRGEARGLLTLARLTSTIVASELPTDGQAIENSIGMKLALIPAGEFIMGDIDKYSDKGAAKHRVRITTPFFMGVHEVTVGQFRRFTAETGYRTKLERESDSPRDYTWQHIGYPQSDLMPVVYVTWEDACAFCKWLSHKEGHVYRLPTEAEWEYACRAGTTTTFQSGDDPMGLHGLANVGDLAEQRAFGYEKVNLAFDDGYAVMAPVGQFRPNTFGLYDMHGNVSEWCLDWYREDYEKLPAHDPLNDSKGEHRVFRGGAWCDLHYSARSYEREHEPPDHADDDVGFRVVRVIEAATGGK